MRQTDLIRQALPYGHFGLLGHLDYGILDPKVGLYSPLELTHYGWGDKSARMIAINNGLAEAKITGQQTTLFHQPVPLKVDGKAVGTHYLAGVRVIEDGDPDIYWLSPFASMPCKPEFQTDLIRRFTPLDGWIKFAERQVHPQQIDSLHLTGFLACLAEHFKIGPRELLWMPNEQMMLTGGVRQQSQVKTELDVFVGCHRYWWAGEALIGETQLDARFRLDLRQLIDLQQRVENMDDMDVFWHVLHNFIDEPAIVSTQIGRHVASNELANEMSAWAMADIIRHMLLNTRNQPDDLADQLEELAEMSMSIADFSGEFAHKVEVGGDVK